MAIAADSIKGYRAYSMHSVAVGQGSNDLDFVVKLSPQGAFSRWISTALMGTPLRLFGPLGRAVLASDDPPRIFAIAGGTGIAGILPIFERLVSSAESEYHGALVFGLRTLSDAFFLDRLNSLVAQSADRIEVIIALSHEHAPATIHDFPLLKIKSGFAVDVAQQYLVTGGDLSETCFFVAGPSMLVESGLSMLRHQFDVQEQRIRFDRF